MKRTGRTLVILTVAAWIAALTPAWADTGPSGAPAPAPGPAGDDLIRIGIGIGGELIDVLNGDEDNGDEDREYGGLLGLLLEDVHVLDLVEDTVAFVAAGENQVVATICQLRHAVANGFAVGLGVIPLVGPILVVIPPIGPMPTCVP